MSAIWKIGGLFPLVIGGLALRRYVKSAGQERKRGEKHAAFIDRVTREHIRKAAKGAACYWPRCEYTYDGPPCARCSQTDPEVHGMGEAPRKVA